MTYRCIVFALLTLIAGCRFTEGQEKAKPTSHSSAAPTTKRPVPTLTFERFEGNDREHFAVFRFGNPSPKPIYFQGYDAIWPQLWIQRRDGDNWKDAGWHWCGTGMDLHELPAGKSVEFHVSLTAQSDFREPMDKSLLDHRQPFRVGTYYGFNRQKIEKRVWSDAARPSNIFQFTSAFVEAPPLEQTPDLIRELKAGDVVQRRRAVILLWAVGMEALRDSEALSDDVINALWQATNDRDTDVRKNALLTLSSHEPDDVRLLPLVLEMFNNEEPTVRETVVGCMSELGPRAASAVPTLIRELNDDYADLADDELTNQLVDVLGHVGPKAKEGIPILVRILDDELLPMSTRSRAAASLGKIKASDRVTIAALEEAATTFVERDSDVPFIFNGRYAGDLSVDLRWQAVRALGQIGKDAKGAVPSLMEVLRHDKGLYRYDATFEDMNGSCIYAVQTTMLAAAAESLVQIDPTSKEILLALRKRLHALSPDDGFPELFLQDIRVSIAGALAVMDTDDPDALAVLREAMGAEWPDTKAVAAKWVGWARLDSPDIVLALQAAVDDENGFLRTCARQALRRIEGK